MKRILLGLALSIAAYSQVIISGGGGGGGGGGGTPGGSTTQIQYNNSSAFGGITGATSDGTNLLVTTQSASDSSTKAASTAFVHNALLSLTVNSVNANASTGAFACDFSLGYICVVSQNGYVGATLTPTLTNLPTNQFVKFVFSMTNLKAVAWPTTQVKCNVGDSFIDCNGIAGNNGFTSADGKMSNTWWSDGTTLWANGDTGYFQTVNTAHANVEALQMEDLQNITNPGDAIQATWWFGGRIKFGPDCSSSASPAACSTYPSGAVALAAAGTTLTVNTSAVRDNSQIIITPDSSLGTKLGVTCNTAAIPSYVVSARTASTSFQITVAVAPVTNPFCFSYFIISN